MKLPSEGDVLKSCLQYLSLRGAFCWRQNQGGMKTERGQFIRFAHVSGISDIIGVMEGRFLAVEVKKPGQKAKPHQEAFLERVRASGGIAGVVTSVKELQELIDGAS